MVANAEGIDLIHPDLYQVLLDLNYRHEVPASAKPPEFRLPRHSWFPDSGVCVVRPAAPGGLGAAWKGGHNAEHHNHNDVGSTVVVWRGQPRIADIGGMVYRAETFSKERYHLIVHSSFAHSVPVVAEFLQVPGRQAAAKVLATDFTDARDSVTMDLRAAYPDAAGLRKLERQWTWLPANEGRLVIEDRFVFAKPAMFATALVGIGEWKLLSQNDETARLVLAGKDGGNLAVTADFSSPSRVDVRHLDNPGKDSGDRLGLNLVSPAADGFIRLTIVPFTGDATTARSLPVEPAPPRLTDPLRAP